MSIQSWQETLVAAKVAGTNFTNFTTAKTVLPDGCLVTLPPNWWYVGRAVRIRASGGMSNIVTTPGTVSLQVMLGSVIAFTTGAVQLNATAHTLLPWRLEVDLTCRSVGTSTAATLMGQGWLDGLMFTRTAAQTDDANTPGDFAAPATAPAVGTGFDSTASAVLDFWCGFSISNSGNAIQVQQYTVEALN